MDRDPRRQHGDDPDRRDRARAGPATALLQIAARGAGHGHEPAHVRPAGHERDADQHGQHSLVRGSRCIGPQVRAAAAYAKQDAARSSPRRASACRSRSCRSARASSRAAASRSPTAQLIGEQAVQRHDAGQLRHGRPPSGVVPIAERCSRVQAPTKPVSQYKLVGTRVPRIDIPDDGHRQGRLRAPTSGCRGCCTGGSCCRVVRRAYGFGAPVALGRRELDQAHSRTRESCAAGDFARRGRADRVRGDPGGCAAEGEVGRSAADLGQRQPLEQDAR